MIDAAIGAGIRTFFSLALFVSFQSDSPWTYSMTSTNSSGELSTSIIDTTFGCWMRAARRASSRNMLAKSLSRARCGWARLMATVRANPEGPARRAKCTVAIPPDAISAA